MIIWYGPDGMPTDERTAMRLFANPQSLRIAQTDLTTGRGRIMISTVFLVIDYAFMGGPPVLWETMAFGGPDDGMQRRYTSHADALAGHQEAVTYIKSALDIEGVELIAEETFTPVTQGDL